MCQCNCTGKETAKGTEYLDSPVLVYQTYRVRRYMVRRKMVRNHKILWWVCYSDFVISGESLKSLKVEYCEAGLRARKEGKQTD